MTSTTLQPLQDLCFLMDHSTVPIPIVIWENLPMYHGKSPRNTIHVLLTQKCPLSVRLTWSKRIHPYGNIYHGWCEIVSYLQFMSNCPKVSLEFVSLPFSELHPSWPFVLLIHLSSSMVKNVQWCGYGNLHLWISS